MLASPDFDEKFYLDQNEKMKSRYASVFKKWKIGWKTYFKDTEKRLRGRTYWIWVYLVGLEAFFKSQKDCVPSEELVETDKNSRISRIVGDYYKIEQYVRNL